MKRARDNRDDNPYGYCEVRKRFHTLKPDLWRTQRVSWIAVLRHGKVFAPMTNVCSCNRNLFQMWLEQRLLPQLPKGDIIVIDNARSSARGVSPAQFASFHYSQTIDEMVA